jgi:N-hydroxyarylamine O-acetyltransferase
MTSGRVAEYLARIGARRDDDLATLTDRHYRSVPFESLSIHLGEPIDLRPEALFDKIGIVLDRLPVPLHPRPTGE